MENKAFALKEKEAIILKDVCFARMKVMHAGEILAPEELPIHSHDCCTAGDEGNRFILETRATRASSRYRPEPEPISCQMINCFCMFSDYQPMTLDEWIKIDRKRRETNTVNGTGKRGPAALRQVVGFGSWIMLRQKKQHGGG